MTLGTRIIATAGRGPGFDQIRLAAAVTVLLHHSRLTQQDIRDPLFMYSGGFMHFGLLAVIVFFSISGFLVTPGLLRTGNIIEFCVNRALRIFPGLLAVVIVAMLILGPMLTSFSCAEYFSTPSLYLYAKNVLTSNYDYLPGVVTRTGQPIVVNGALWTLHFEVLSYGLLALLSLIGILRRPIAFLVVVAIVYATYVLMNFVPPLAAHVPGRLANLIGLFVYFAVGAALFVFRDRVPFSGALCLAAFVAILLALPVGLGPVLLPICLPYITMYAGLSLLPGATLVRRDLSYGVYLIHAPVLVALGFVFHPGVGWWWLALAVFAVTAGLSYLSRALIEEPALKQKKAVLRWIDGRLAGPRSWLGSMYSGLPRD